MPGQGDRVCPADVAVLVTVLFALAAVPASAAADDRYSPDRRRTGNDCLVGGDAVPDDPARGRRSVTDDTVDVTAGTYTVPVERRPSRSPIFGPFACGCVEPEDPSRAGPRGADRRRQRQPGGRGQRLRRLLIGLTFGPAAGPATGTGVSFQSGADDHGGRLLPSSST